MYKALYLSPMIPSFSITDTTAFFTDILGFGKALDTPGYVICHKDNLTVHLLNAGPDIGQMEFYLEVDQLDSLWEQIREKVAGLRIRAPFDRDYGMRELHIEIPYTNTLLFIGQSINS